MNSTNNSEFSVERNSQLSDKLKSEFLELGHYLFLKLKSPYTIIGLAIVIFATVISIFPQILTPYSFEASVGVSSGEWGAPSPQHPLGQTRFGRDVLARIIYGISDSLVFSLFGVLIGLAGAFIIGIPLNVLNKRLNISSEIVLIPIFMVPLILLIIYTVFMMIPLFFFFGVYLVPVLIHLITKENLSVYEIGKKIIPFIPLVMGITILIYNLMGFLGFSSSIIQIGYDIAIARLNLYTAPWAAVFPSLVVFILLSGFFILYAGLQQSPEGLHEIKRIA